ncbi:MAG: ABC transporter permease [Elusimicrobiota bacterium]|jgi:phospholipid/cholesterol/gamma-HCH transport system permease protein|nr:ABC transporter permease [Elusimicrobiota bacterium]
MFKTLGKLILDFLNQLGQASEMVASCIFWLMRAPLEFKQTVLQTTRIGVDSFAVATMTSLFTGMVLALQAGTTMRNILSEPLYIGTIVGFSLVRELGPVLTAFVVAGRAGAAITAEIGTMKVTEQIDALHTLGTNPIRYLVIPRIIAFMIAIPVLTLCANFSGMFGGYLVSTQSLAVSSWVYYEDITTFLGVDDVMHGFIKSFCFAFMIAVVCCYKGLNTYGGAEGVGRATTKAVVASMVLILVMDYFLTAILQSIGI